jgi:hypothetical protein
MTGLFRATAATSAVERRDCMQRLYQWLSERASFFRYYASGHGVSSTLRTETTVRREGITLLVGGAAVLGLDICPLCGGKLSAEQSEEARHRLTKGAIPQKAGPVDSQPP